MWPAVYSVYVLILPGDVADETFTQFVAGLGIWVAQVALTYG